MHCGGVLCPSRRIKLVCNRCGGCYSTFPGCSSRTKALISLIPGVLAKRNCFHWAHTLSLGAMHKWRYKDLVPCHQFKTSLLGHEHSRVLRGSCWSLCSKVLTAPSLPSDHTCCHDPFRSIAPESISRQIFCTRTSISELVPRVSELRQLVQEWPNQDGSKMGFWRQVSCLPAAMGTPLTVLAGQLLKFLPLVNWEEVWEEGYALADAIYQAFERFWESNHYLIK